MKKVTWCIFIFYWKYHKHRFHTNVYLPKKILVLDVIGKCHSNHFSFRRKNNKKLVECPIHKFFHTSLTITYNNRDVVNASCTMRGRLAYFPFPRKQVGAAWITSPIFLGPPSLTSSQLHAKRRKAWLTLVSIPSSSYVPKPQNQTHNWTSSTHGPLLLLD